MRDKGFQKQSVSADINRPKWVRRIVWYYHKMLCEIGYKVFGSTSNMYYHNLERLCKQGWNLYGTEMKPNPIKGKI